MAPFFSVVIPTYNQADFLRAALRSVLDQTYQNYEVIIVNNYSTDHTLDVIREISDPRIQVTDFQNHGVIGAARNVGIKASQGDYVAFLDSDDLWYTNKLEMVSQAISADPEIGLICHNQDTFREGVKAGVARLGPKPGFKGDMQDYLLINGNCVSTSATVVARKYLTEVGNFSEDPKLATVEDYDLWLNLSKVCTFQFLTELLGAHNYHLASASAKAQLHLNATLAVLDRHSKLVPKDQLPRVMRATRRFHSRAYYGAARQCHRNGELKRTLGYYAKSILTYPLYPRGYLALILLFSDVLLGPARRQKLFRALWRGKWPASWMFS